MDELEALHGAGVLSGRSYPEALVEALASLGLSPGLLAAAERLAALCPGLDAPTRERVARLLAAVRMNEQRGSTYLAIGPAGSPRDALADLGLPLEELAPLLDDPRLSPLVGPDRPLVRVPGGLASHRAARAEARIAEELARLAVRPVEPLRFPDSILELPVALHPDQRRAVERATRSALTVVTGGPGTGKTSIVAAILRALVAGGTAVDRIALAAPTGKAAQRMGEALRAALSRLGPDAPGASLRDAPLSPMTLHRLLGFHPEEGRFRFHADDPLETDVVLVDESSMVDLVLLRGLVEALPPTARLVLLGDADQLPSVGAGAVLRDLVAARPDVTVRLTHSYRMDERDPAGRHVLVVARRTVSAPRDPSTPDLFEGEDGIRVRARPSELRRMGVELVEGGASAIDRLLSPYVASLFEPTEHGTPSEPLRIANGELRPEDLERVRALLARLDRTRVLCPVNEGERWRSVSSLNERCHELARARTATGRDFAFQVGEPIMVTENDYGRGLWNGDQGIVLFVSRDGGPVAAEAVFPRGDGLLSFPVDSLAATIRHAYALTVHKSQGSEFESVLLVLPSKDHPIVTSEILYTAMTRARRSVLIVGESEVLRVGARRTVVRTTHLATLLAPAGVEAPSAPPVT
ncbi:MAG: exodeoxyribonuclease V subunit alpha [Polyangiales bacterium]